MKNFILLVCSSLVVVVSCASNAEPAPWGYAGKTGPEHWASLSSDFTLCASGKNQSPVDVDSKKSLDVQERGIKFNYGHITPGSIKNTGNRIQVDVEPGTNIRVDGVQFELKNLVFHIPSENTIDNKHFPMEIQFIHQSSKNELAIVSRFVVPGRSDRTLRKLLKTFPLKVGESKPLAAGSLRAIEMKKKLPGYYRYDGSLTSPPCTEGVRWFLMKSLMTQSKEQYNKFKDAIKQDNNRPLQPLNARMILR